MHLPHIPQCTILEQKCAHFCSKVVYCGIWDRCIVGFSHVSQCTTLEEKCVHFCSKVVYCGIWDRCIVGFVNLVYLVCINSMWNSCWYDFNTIIMKIFIMRHSLEHLQPDAGCSYDGALRKKYNWKNAFTYTILMWSLSQAARIIPFHKIRHKCSILLFLLCQYINIVKLKVSWLPNLYNGNHYTWKDYLYINSL